MKTREKVSVVTLGCARIQLIQKKDFLRQLQLNNLDLCTNPTEADTVIIQPVDLLKQLGRIDHTIMSAVAARNQVSQKEFL